MDLATRSRLPRRVRRARPRSAKHRRPFPRPARARRTRPDGGRMSHPEQGAAVGGASLARGARARFPTAAARHQRLWPPPLSRRALGNAGQQLGTVSGSALSYRSPSPGSRCQLDPIRGEAKARLEDRRQHRHFEQLVDRPVAIGGGGAPPQSPRPSRRPHRCPGRPTRRRAVRPAGPRPNRSSEAISSSSTLVLIESSRTDSVSSPSSSTFSGASPPS